MDDLSVGVKAVWGVEERRRGGPKPALTVHRIVATAISLADPDGLEACSMPKLAKQLGCGTMSIYRHVADKAELENLMRDVAIGPLPPVMPPTADWRETLDLYVEHFSRQYRAHSWILDVPVTGFPNTPNVLAWLNRGLAALKRIGLDSRSCLGIMLLLDGHIASSMRIQRTPSSANPLPPPELLTQHGLQTVRDIAMSQDARAEFRDSGLQFGVQQVLERVAQLAEARTER